MIEHLDDGSLSVNGSVMNAHTMTIGDCRVSKIVDARRFWYVTAGDVTYRTNKACASMTRRPWTGAW
jgi:hypothetical protein